MSTPNWERDMFDSENLATATHTAQRQGIDIGSDRFQSSLRMFEEVIRVLNGHEEWSQSLIDSFSNLLQQAEVNPIEFSINEDEELDLSNSKHARLISLQLTLMVYDLIHRQRLDRNLALLIVAHAYEEVMEESDIDFMSSDQYFRLIAPSFLANQN